jgi:hypothetical protein
MFQHDSIFFIGVFIFIFFLWLVLGGPARPLSFGGPLLSGPGAIGGGTYLSLPKAPSLGTSEVGQSQASGAGSSQGLSYQDQQSVNNALKAASFGSPSTYRGVVTLNHYVSTAGASDPQNEYIQLEVSPSADGPVNLTGWSLTSDVTGKGATIPQGTEIPRSGVINPIEPIVLYPGDRALISSGRSPIGASFRENICIAYFEQFQKFSPSLPNSCPTPNSELELHYGPDLVRDPPCINYVDRLSRCSLVLSPPVTLTGTCQSFLTNYLNYNGCLSAHQNDYNFKGTTWRIYLGRDISMWRSSREAVKLLDASGKTVDMFTY